MDARRSSTARARRPVGKEYVEVHAGGRSATLNDFRSLELHGAGRTRTSKSSGDKGHDAQFAALREGTAIDGPDPLDTMAVTVAALQSAQTGEAVRIPWRPRPRAGREPLRRNGFDPPLEELWRGQDFVVAPRSGPSAPLHFSVVFDQSPKNALEIGLKCFALLGLDEDCLFVRHGVDDAFATSRDDRAPPAMASMIEIGCPSGGYRVGSARTWQR